MIHDTGSHDQDGGMGPAKQNLQPYQCSIDKIPEEDLVHRQVDYVPTVRDWVPAYFAYDQQFDSDTEVELRRVFVPEPSHQHFQPHVNTGTADLSQPIPRSDLLHNGGTELEPDLLYDICANFDRYKHYEPVVVDYTLEVVTDRNFGFHANRLGSQLHIPGWDYELAHENDIRLKDYLSYGVHNGFPIIDEGCHVPAYECTNYTSALKGEAFDCINQIVMSELSSGKYIVSDNKPHCVHSIGAVPKKDSSSWRPITDCKRPLGHSINGFMLSTVPKFCYTTLDNIIDMLEPGMFMASVDISLAYRSILVHPGHWQFQGISWPVNGTHTYLLDTHLCFGLRCAPYIFTQISNFILRCFQRRGFTNCAVYLDNFFVTGNTEAECAAAQQTLIGILRSLGFHIVSKKCVSPSQKIDYLGVTLDTNEMSVSIPPGKMEKLHSELEFFQGKKRATLKQIQRLCGILAHCSKVIKGGRTFSHRIIELLRGWPEGCKRIRLGQQLCMTCCGGKTFPTCLTGKIS